jgi:hypothetical protein
VDAFELAAFERPAVNRHARRAAAARARGRRGGYLHRLVAAMAGGMMPAVGVHLTTIEHDGDCAIYHGQGCDCVPDISVSGPDGVVAIDERGTARKVARS